MASSKILNKYPAVKMPGVTMSGVVIENFHDNVDLCTVGMWKNSNDPTGAPDNHKWGGYLMFKPKEDEGLILYFDDTAVFLNQVKAGGLTSWLKIGGGT